MNYDSFEKLLKSLSVSLNNSDKVFQYLDYELNNSIEYYN